MNKKEYEKRYYEKYVRHCHENNCGGCDYCVPYDETMNGRAEAYEYMQKQKAKPKKVVDVEPVIKYNYKIGLYIDITNGKILKGD